MYILGINSLYHESAACLLRDGVLVAAAEEERFTRFKHGKEARADNPDELPVHAIDFCLRTAGIGPEAVSHVACAGDPVEMHAVRRDGRLSAWDDPAKQDLFLNSLPRVPQRVADLGFAGAFHWVPHHRAHAASAFYPSPYADAAVLVVDALGDDAFSAQFFHGRDRELSLLKSVHHPASIGYLWELVSIFLGFGVYDAAKVMGLAAYGDPGRFAAAFDRLAWATPDGGFGMAHDLLQFQRILYYPPSAWFDGLHRLFGIGPRAPDAPLTGDHYDVAAALQGKTDELLLHMAGHLRTLTGSPNLCLAGGVALNCVTNARLLGSGLFDGLYVQPAAHDGGLPLGAAWHVWHETLGQPRCAQMRHAYWGPAFSDDDIAAELARNGVDFAPEPGLEDVVARLISEGHVVGLFQGAMELGPRALGNRSILADPRHRDMRDVLNRKIKHREFFRPLSPSVLAEHAHEWFDMPENPQGADFMLMAFPAKEERRSRIAAVLHEDGTGRIQLVRKDTNPRFHRIIEAYGALTGVPMVLNTSFNDQEPIICTPADAITTFLKTDIDVLAIGSFLAWKEPSRDAVQRLRGAAGVTAA